MKLKPTLQNLDTVHTHTHTHTDVLRGNLIISKINIEAYVLYSLLCVSKDLN